MCGCVYSRTLGELWLAIGVGSGVLPWCVPCYAESTEWVGRCCRTNCDSQVSTCKSCFPELKKQKKKNSEKKKFAQCKLYIVYEVACNIQLKHAVLCLLLCCIQLHVCNRLNFLYVYVAHS